MNAVIILHENNILFLVIDTFFIDIMCIKISVYFFRHLQISLFYLIHHYCFLHLTILDASMQNDVPVLWSLEVQDENLFILLVDNHLRVRLQRNLLRIPTCPCVEELETIDLPKALLRLRQMEVLLGLICFQVLAEKQLFLILEIIFQQL